MADKVAYQGQRGDQYTEKVSPLADEDRINLFDSADLDGNNRKKTKQFKAKIINDIIDDVSANTSAIAGIVDPLSVEKSADYTILDDDGYSQINMTTGATDKTITLPTLADNLDREITIFKVDSGTNYMIVDGEGAETITYKGISQTTITCELQGSGIRVKASATTWNIIEIIGAEIIDISGVLELEYEKTLTGTLNSTPTTNVVHGVNYDKVTKAFGECKTSTNLWSMYGFLEQNAPTNAFFFTRDATYFTFNSVGSAFYAQSYRVTFSYYI